MPDEPKIMTTASGLAYLYKLVVEGRMDEPIFILRGQDELADIIVSRWASLAEKAGVNAEKVAGADAQAKAMAQWRPRKLPD